MYFSGKVTNSIVSYLSQSGGDLDKLEDITDLSLDFLRDPSYWLTANQVEKFLEQVQEVYGPSLAIDNVCEATGHCSYKLQSWGVLDSVLRMMMSPKDIFIQPQRFISYFISPAPPVGNVLMKDPLNTQHVSFELPISHDEYPLFCTYLKASLESLPQFMNRPMAHIEWKKNELYVDWEDRQKELKEMEVKQFKPEFVQNLLLTLESTEKKLENKNREIEDQKFEIEELKSQLEATPWKKTSQLPKVEEQEKDWKEKKGKDWKEKGLEEKIFVSLRDIYKSWMCLSDYITRTQQLVVLLVGQDRKDKQVKEAMKRIQWDTVRTQFPHVVQAGLDHISELSAQAHEMKSVLEEKTSEEKASEKALLRVSSLEDNVK